MARLLSFFVAFLLISCGNTPTNPNPNGGDNTPLLPGTTDSQNPPGAVLSAPSGTNYTPIKSTIKAIAETSLPADVYAMINGKPLTDAAINERLKIYPQIPEQQRDQIRRRTGEMLIAERLIDMSLSSGQINISDEDLKASTDRFNDMLKENDMTRAEYIEKSKASEKQMERMFRVEALLWSQVNEVETKKILVEIEDKVEEARTIDLILKGGQGIAEDEKPKLKIEASKLRDRALKGEDFTTLILEYSDDPSAKQTKGRLGPITRKTLKPELAKMTESIFNLSKEGDVSEIIETPLGFMLMKLVEVQKETITVGGGQMGPPRTMPVKEYCEGMVYSKAKGEFFKALFANNVIVRQPLPAQPEGSGGSMPPPRR